MLKATVYTDKSKQLLKESLDRIILQKIVHKKHQIINSQGIMKKVNGKKEDYFGIMEHLYMTGIFKTV